VPEKGRLKGSEILINSTGTGTLGRVALAPIGFEEPTFVDTHVSRCSARGPIEPTLASSRMPSVSPVFVPSQKKR
jgi:hypothetical protein